MSQLQEKVMGTAAGERNGASCRKRQSTAYTLNVHLKIRKL